MAPGATCFGGHRRRREWLIRPDMQLESQQQGDSDESCCANRGRCGSVGRLRLVGARAGRRHSEKPLTVSMARTIADGALDECKKQGFNTSVAVLDRAGQVLVLMRDEAASPVTLEMAQRKA